MVSTGSSGQGSEDLLAAAIVETQNGRLLALNLDDCETPKVASLTLRIADWPLVEMEL